MKRWIYHILSLIFVTCSCLLLTNVFWQWFELWNNSTILNTDINQAIDTSTSDWWTTIWDPLREWAYHIVNADDWEIEHQIPNIINNNEAITDHNTALSNTLNIVTSIINYALGLISLVALIYLLVHGFIILTAAWDEAKYKKWLKWIKYATIALLGVWLSRLIISLIFRIIENISTAAYTP